MSEPRGLITVDPSAKYAAAAAAVLCVLIPSLTWCYSWLVPGQAVWALNGDPLLPPESAS